MNKTLKQYIKRIIKVIAFVISAILVLLLLGTLIFQLPKVQNYIADIAVKKVEEKAGVKVAIDKIAISLYGSVNVKGLYAQDNKRDTLFYAQQLKVKVSLLNILNKTVQINDVKLEDARIRVIMQDQDSTMNFSPYIMAFQKAESEKVEKPENTNKKFAVELKRVQLVDVRFLYKSIPDQNFVKVNTGDFDLKLNDTDFKKKIIDIKNVSLEGTAVDVLINNKKYSSDSKPFPLDLNLQKDLSLTDVHFRLLDNFSRQKLDFDNINLTVATKNLNLKDKQIHLDRIELYNSYFNVEKFSMSRMDSARVDSFNALKTDNEFEWAIIANEIKLDNNSFGFSEENHKNLQYKVNYSDLHFDQIKGTLINVDLHRYFLSAQIQDFSALEKSGFKLDHFATEFQFSATQTSIKNFVLESPYTRISQNVILKYSSVEELRQNLTAINFELKLDSSTIGITDIDYLLPRNLDSIPYVSKLSHNIQLATNIGVHNDTLTIEYLKSAYDSTSLRLSGMLKNYTKLSDSTMADIVISQLKTTKKNITTFLPDTMLPDLITLPSTIKLKAQFNGNKNIFKTQNQIITDFGEIIVNAQTTKEDSTQRRSYHSELRLEDFNLGRLFDNDTLGTISQSTTVNGTLPLKQYSDVTADVKTNIKEFTYLNYLYTDIEMEGSVTNEKIEADISYADSNLIFSFLGRFYRDDSVPEFEMDINLEGADLQELNLSKSDLKARGKMQASFSGDKLNNANGELEMSDIILLKDNEVYTIDSITTWLTNQKNKSTMTLKSSFLTADYSGTIKPGNIYLSLKKHLSDYIPGSNDTTLNQYDKGKFEFSLRLFNSEIITQALIPELKSILPSSLNSKYDAEKNEFSLSVDFPQIEYSNVSIENLILDLYTNDSTNLTYKLSFDEINADPVVLGRTELIGKGVADSLKFMLRVPGDKTNPKFLLGAYLTQSNNNLKLNFISSFMTLNYKDFKLPEDNYVLLTPEMAKFHNMRFYTDKEQLEITADTSKQHKYNLQLSNFEISNITELIETETEIIGGTLNGNIALDNRKNNKLFNTDLIVSNMFINNYRVFDQVKIRANNVQENRIEINSTFLGAQDELEMRGYISRLNNENQLDFNVDIKTLNLVYFETFTADFLDDLEGSIVGDIQVSGNTKSPYFNGELNFKDISVKPDYLNTALKVNDETLKINNNRVLFNNFTLSDFENNNTQLNGFVDFREIRKPNFNISVSSKNFRFLNTEYQDGRLYYGKVRANLNADITGNPEQPNVNLTVFLGNNSEFHFVIPELTTASVEEEGVVRFVNKQDTIWTSVFKKEPEIKDSLQALDGTGISLSANIEIDEGMDIFIEIDPASNEELFLNGNANLSFQKRRAETPTLNGRFEIQDGTYTLTLYEVIRRTFSIEPGSYLTWNGNVQNPVTDITTTYSVRTSPTPLISNETADFNAENTTRYSNNTPFLINLNIEGELLKPELNFQLSTPPGQSDALIQAKLAQLNQNESQLHKQVFSLLLFNSFIESTSASNRSTAYELNATARTSVSKLLTRQISNFADRYIKYVDLDVGVNSYYNRVGDQASGQTEVSLDVSKQLFNNKLRVQLGGDFNVENANTTTDEQTKNNNNIAGDFIIEYKLDEDGTYRIQGFNKTEYEDFFDGEVNKTGAAFIFNKDFYKLKQLFKSDTTKNKRNRK